MKTGTAEAFVPTKIPRDGCPGNFRFRFMFQKVFCFAVICCNDYFLSSSVMEENPFPASAVAFFSSLPPAFFPRRPVRFRQNNRGNDTDHSRQFIYSKRFVKDGHTDCSGNERFHRSQNRGSSRIHSAQSLCIKTETAVLC